MLAKEPVNHALDEVQGHLLGIQPLPSINEIFAEVQHKEHCKCGMMVLLFLLQ